MAEKNVNQPASQRLVRDEQGQVSSVKVIDLVSKVLILILGLLCTLLLSAMGEATAERKIIQEHVHSCETRLSVIEGNRWNSKDQAQHDQMLATRFETIWKRIIILESRPFPEAPPTWFKEQVDRLGDKVDQNTELIIELKTKVDRINK